MPLQHGQAQIRDLLLGPGSAYRLLSDTNPWNLLVRAEQGGKRPWNHGAWSGAEWAEEKVVPVVVAIDTDDPVDWLALHQQLAAAFRPVGEITTDVELRIGWGGAEYVLFGRPRMVEPHVRTAGSGKTITEAAFVALDPIIYSADEQVEALGLPSFTGGLTIPVQAPFTVDGVLVGGKVTVENEGTADTPLALRVDGPVQSPRVTLQRPDGLIQTLQVLFDLGAGQWLDIDTGAHTVLLNGTTNRRGQVAGVFPILPPGVSTLRFQAAAFHDDAELTARWRHAWW